MASASKASIAEFYANRGTWPVTNGSAGVGSADSIDGKYVSSITIAGGGITVLYGHEANVKNLMGKKVGLQPGASTNGDVIWRCGYGANPSGWSGTAGTTGSTTVAGKYLPSVCR